MPKYWGKQIFTHRSFPEVGQKTERRKKKKKREERKWVIIMDSYALQTPPLVAHAKRPGPKTKSYTEVKFQNAYKSNWLKIGWHSAIKCAL